MVERHAGRIKVTIHEGEPLKDEKVDEWLQMLRDGNEEAELQIGIALEWKDKQVIDFVKRAYKKDPRTIQGCFENFLNNGICDES